MKPFKIVIFSILLILLTSADGKEKFDALIVELDAIGETKIPAQLDRKAIISNQLAVYFQSVQAFEQSRLYLLKAIEFTEKRIAIEKDWNVQNLHDMGELYNNLASIEASAGHIDDAKAAFDTFRVFLFRQQSKLPPDEFQLELGKFYRSGFVWAYHAHEYALAEDYMKKALTIASRYDSIKELVELYRSYGELRAKTNDLKGALRFMNQAIEIHKKAFPEKPVQMNVLQSTSAILYRLKDYEGVISFLTAQEYFRSTKQMEIAFEKADLEHKTILLNTSFILSFAYIRAYEKSQDRHQLEIAQKWQGVAYDIAERTIFQHGADKLGSIISSPEQKITSTLRNYELLQETGRLNKTEISQLLRILDVHNSTKLHLDRLNNELNYTVWQQQKQLKLRLEELTRLNPNWRDQSISDKELDSITDLCYTISMEIQALDSYTKRDALLNEYQIGQDGFISKLQKFVASNDKTILSYFWSENLNALYLVGISKDNSFFRKVDTPKDFTTRIEEAYALNSKLNMDRATMQRQQELNKELYDYFIQPIAAQLSKNRGLLIYPFGISSYVSFDAIIQPSKRFMVQDYTIGYTSSLFSMLRPQQKMRSKNATVTSFYPENYGTDTLSYLFHAKNEIQSFERYGDPTSFQGKKATKKQFLNEANTSKILHISSHSILNFEDPYKSYLIFDADQTKDNKMFAYEIFAESFNADLVTLSSCNSSSGSLETGIGMVSLANAFYFSGIPATVGSMWSAQDKSSSEIMIDFYANLFTGKKKSESLTYAKRKYLATADNLTRQPFFWANYVLYGSDVTVVKAKKQSNGVWLVSAGIVVLLFLSVGYFKCSKSSLARS